MSQYAILGLAFLLAAIGGYKAWQSVMKNPYGSDSLYFLGAAALVLVSDRLKEVERTKDGGWKIGLHEAIRQEVQQAISTEVKPQLKEIGNLAASAAAPPAIAPGPAEVPASLQDAASIPPLSGQADGMVALPPPTVADDPQKGRFGGQACSRGRCLSARLDPAPPGARFYTVHLEVSRVDPATEPLKGSVCFHLHDTFRPSLQEVRVADGVARLSLMSYGAFTVGAVADGGATLLELDLAEDTRFPDSFRMS